jgi:phenylacetate-CoA ligase
VLSAACILESQGGELLVTNLRNRVFPLVRYRTGDLGAVEPGDEPCACGARGPVLARLEGRLVSRFVTGDGRPVDPSQLQPVLSGLRVRQFQLRQTGPARVLLRYVADGEVDRGRARELEAALGFLLGSPTVLDLERSEGLLFRPGEKPLVYVSDVSRERGGVRGGAA